MKRKKKIRNRILLMAILGWVYSNYAINNASADKTYDSAELIPHNEVGLLLGVSKYINNGRLNSYYMNRLYATADLYHANKINYVLVSGDNSRKEYNEPAEFKSDLIRLGIPKEKIFLDYAGFRTLDSVVRANKVFGLDSFTVISQKFHNKRAIYLSKHNDMNAIGYNAKGVAGRMGLRTSLREQLAKTKAVVDIILDVQPKFLGAPITIQ